jgi:Zn-dependent alcohol dehydrogenase
MKAAVLHAANHPLTIEEVALAKPGPREVSSRRSAKVSPMSSRATM